MGISSSKLGLIGSGLGLGVCGLGPEGLDDCNQDPDAHQTISTSVVVLFNSETCRDHNCLRTHSSGAWFQDALRCVTSGLDEQAKATTRGLFQDYICAATETEVALSLETSSEEAEE